MRRDDVPVILGPMAGVTDMPARLLALEQGASFCVTEMLSAKGYLYAPRDARATVSLTRRDPRETRLGLQLFGREPDLIARAAAELSDKGFAFIDLNMGCPAPKITGNGEGSALMREPELAQAVAAAAVRATHLPVTVKIRAGWDSVTAPELARRLQNAGVRAIAVHARTRMQFYSGKADWSVIQAVKRAVSLPVIGNGDIVDGESAARMLEETGCDGLMVARAAQGNPWIFAQIRAHLRGEPWNAPSVEERVRTALRHLDMQIALDGEEHAVREMRKHIAWYVSGLRGSARLREKINALPRAQQVRDCLLEYAAQI